MTAAVLEQINAPLSVMDVELPRPWAGAPGVQLDIGQVLIRVLTAGICGAQLQEIDGHKGDPAHLPHLLGHEGCGIVEEIGPGVRKVAKGDKVVLHWRKSEGVEACPPKYQCAENEIKSGPVTTFSEFTVVSENRITQIPHDLPDELAALLGCALSTALAVAENNIRWGHNVLVIGCGGVGLSMIMAARLAHAANIIAVDKADKRQMAEALGAEFMLLKGDLVFPDAFDVIIDTAATGAVMGVIADFLRDNGKYIRVAQFAGKDTAILAHPNLLFSPNGKTIVATQAGGFNPGRDIPRYVNLWRSGALDDYDKLITHRITLYQINDAIGLMRNGKTGRVMIKMAENAKL